MDHNLSPEQFHAVVKALERKNKIEAIKMYREATGLGLAESKDAVEALDVLGGLHRNSLPLEGNKPLRARDPFAEKKKGCSGIIVVFGLFAGFVFLFW